MVTCCRGVVDQERDKRADDRDDCAVNVQPGEAGCAEQVKEETTDKSADDS
jgi:hypothetical protein